MRKLLFSFCAMAIFCAAGGIYMSEIATHVYDALRWLPPRGVAEAVAARGGAELTDAEIAAGDGARLRAWVYSPSHPNGTAVLALHGVGGHRGHMLGYAGLLARHGFTVITPDSRGHGSSDGGVFTYGVVEAGDVSRWTDFALARPAVNRVAGLGESMGAAILLQTLARDRRLRAIVAEAPFARFDEIAKGRMEQRASLLAIPVLEPGFLYFRMRYGFDLRAASPIDALRSAMSRPEPPRLLLIHSPGDRNIPVWHSHRLRDVAPSKIEFWEPANVAHTQALGTLPDEFERRVTTFLKALP